MADDLTTRLLVAIEETEKIAHAAAARAGMKWEADPDTQYLGGSVTSCSTGDTIVYPEGRPTEDEAAHIGRHDPANVLRHCAAHRKIVELHTLTWASGHPEYGYHYETTAESKRMVEVPNAEPDAPYYCATCADQGPCPTLLALAEGYDLTAEPAP